MFTDHTAQFVFSNMLYRLINKVFLYEGNEVALYSSMGVVALLQQVEAGITPYKPMFNTMTFINSRD